MTVHTHGTASGADQHPADVAQQETGRVAQEASQQARDLAGELRTQVEQQADQQRTRAAGSLRSLGDGLHEMAENGGPGPAQDLVRDIASRARNLSDYVDGHDAAELLDEVRSIARRRPMVFLAGAAVAGAVVGRLSRGVFSAATGGEGLTGSSSSSSAGYTTPAVPPVTPATAAPPARSTGATEPLDAPVLGTTGPTARSEALPDDATLGPLGTTTRREEPPRASGTEGSFHG